MTGCVGQCTTGPTLPVRPAAYKHTHARAHVHTHTHTGALTIELPMDSYSCCKFTLEWCKLFRSINDWRKKRIHQVTALFAVVHTQVGVSTRARPTHHRQIIVELLHAFYNESDIVPQDVVNHFRKDSAVDVVLFDVVARQLVKNLMALGGSGERMGQVSAV